MTALTTEQKWLLNYRMGPVANKVMLGDLMEDALDVDQDEITTPAGAAASRDDVISVAFDEPALCCAKVGGGAATGTEGDENVMYTCGQAFEYHIIGTQTIVGPAWDASGLLASLDLTDNDGVEYTQGITARSKAAYTIGTDRCFFQARVKVADVSGLDVCLVGFRKAEAYQVDPDDYDEAAALNVISGDINISTILNAGATSETDTTQNLADGEYVDLRVECDDTAGLAAAIALATELRSTFNAHCASSIHGTAVDPTVIATAIPTTLAGLIETITELRTDYAAHDVDAEKATPVYHSAQRTSEASLASLTPSTLITCHACLNDLKTKYNIHAGDATAHDSAGTAITANASGNVFFKVGVNGTAIAAATVHAGFSFDNGEVVVPFALFRHDTTTPGTIYLQSWSHGLLD